MEAELPEGWTLEPFGLFANNVKERWEPGDETMEYIGLEHIASAQGSLVASQSSAAVTSAKTRFKRGDTLFGKLRPNLRKYYRADFDGICSTDILALRPKSGMDGAFIYYVVHSADFIRYAVNDASGTKMPRTSWKRLAELHCLKPPLPEQQRIAEILTAVDDSIRAGERVIEQAERVKKGLMEELLTGGLGSAAIERGEVPKGWSGGTAGKLAEPKGLQTGPFGSQLKSEDYDADGTVHVVMPKDISDGAITYNTTANISVGRAEPLFKHRLRYGDILFARRGDLSKIAVYLGGSQAICGTGCLRLRPQMDQFDALFLRYLFSMPYAARWLEANAVGATMLNLNTKIIAELPVSYPTEIEQQRRIASILIGIDDQIAAEQKHVEQQKRLKQGLMDDLLTGRVRTV
jgi:type I restriction enzyme S subunit